MHEMGIASSIIEAVETELRPYPQARPVRITVTIGAMAGVERSSLEFCFEAIIKGTRLEGMVLDVREAAADELELSQLELEEDEPEGATP